MNGVTTGQASDNSWGGTSKLDVRNVEKTFYTNVGFGQKRATTALRDINLSVGEGEFLTVIGPSGCGKSTLLMLIAGLIDVSSGEIALDGKKIVGPGLDRGVVFQDFVLFPWQTVEGNIRFGMRKRHLGHATEAETIASLMRLVSLEGFGKYYPNQLSGGMQQRVAIARALAGDPSLLLMDEPFGSLDAQTRSGLQQQFESIWQETGKTVLFVTHSVREAVFLSDRVVVLGRRPGRVVDDIRIALPRPRKVFTDDFAEYERVLGRSLAAQAGQAEDVAFTD